MRDAEEGNPAEGNPADGGESSPDRSADPEARSGRAVGFALTLTRALLESVELRRILYVILSGATAGDGLGFNRALLFLEDSGGRTLRGQLAVGPETVEEASAIWEAMEAEQFDLVRVMHQYDHFEMDPRAARLSRWLERVRFPLPMGAAPTSSMGGGAREGERPLADLLAAVLATNQVVLEVARPVSAPGLGSALRPTAAAPLCLEERVIGVLVVDNAFNGGSIGPDDLRNLQTLADLAAVAVERARLYERLQQMAEQDGLTGLLNRRGFEERFEALLALSRRQGEALSVLLVDADYFKAVNDQLGHQVGDDLLRGLAAKVSERIRQGDLAGRYGGDEMVVALRGAGGVEALRVAEQLCRAVQGIELGIQGVARPSISVGVAEVRPGHGGLASVLAEADQALYGAKHAGRGRARLYRPL